MFLTILTVFFIVISFIDTRFDMLVKYMATS